MGLMFTVFFVGFLVGIFTVIGLESLGIWFVIVRLSQKTRKLEELQSESGDLDLQQSLDFLRRKQGDVWVLEAEKIPKNWLEKVPRDPKRKRDYIEVSPVRKHAMIKDHWLVITETDGSPTTVQLKGCEIEAVSATHLPSRKWAKRFPIKLESKTSAIYKGSKFFYIYLETSWEKESWCKALRLAACHDKKRHLWYSRLQEDFKSYLMSLHEGYPSFLKPSGLLYAESVDKENKTDNNPSKVRLIWKKFAKKVAKAAENRSSATSLSGRDERKTTEKLRSYQDTVPATYSMRAATLLLKAAEENYAPQRLSSLPNFGSQSHVSVTSEGDSDDKLVLDEGTLCWNLLISRLFFDMKNNDEIKRSIQARIQRTLSNMRIPSYIGEVTCTGIGTGNLPPHLHGMRVLPADMNETWAFEVDIEYNGGAVLEIETRLEVRDLDMVDQHIESNAVDDVSAGLLEDFEYLGKQLNLPEEKADVPEHTGEPDPRTEGLKLSKSNISATNYKSKLKTMLNAFAKQVAQVPISLQIKVASLRGTLQVHVKPPPSDQLWYGFTSMPEIEFNLESSVGDHKITSGQIAMYLINRFKASIRETMVLPNFESICISWMLAEKDDWAPRKAAPFIWLNQETTKDSVHDKPSPEQNSKSESSSQSSSNHSESKPDKTNNIGISQPSISESTDTLVPRSSSTGSLEESGSLSDLTTPLIMSNESPEGSTRDREIPVGEGPSRYISLAESRIVNSEDDDSRPKKMGRRARMFDLGKKMGEKLEEKRRQMEEKSRHIVEKMRGPQDNKP